MIKTKILIANNPQSLEEEVNTFLFNKAMTTKSEAEAGKGTNYIIDIKYNSQVMGTTDEMYSRYSALIIYRCKG